MVARACIKAASDLTWAVKFRSHRKVFPTESECQRIGQKYGAIPCRSGTHLFVAQTQPFPGAEREPNGPPPGTRVSWATFFAELVARNLCVYYYRGSPPQLLHVGYLPGARPARV